MPRETKADRRIRERGEERQREREELWRRIEEGKTPEKVMEIMRGKIDQYGPMSVSQYRQPEHSYLMNARNQLWDRFWDALEEGAQ